MARLSGTGGLADDLYLLAHHEVTGQPHLQPRAIGLGLAGALLAALWIPTGQEAVGQPAGYGERLATTASAQSLSPPWRAGEVAGIDSYYFAR